MDKKISSKQIRQLWLDFFANKNHLVVESKSLVPHNDPSLLWINSGVATLKDYFTGKKTPPSKRITNSQKAIRTNDIENVGITSRHHTMFEMLGNFSIGDYFKTEAIAFAFEFLTKYLKLEKDRLYITYFAEDEKTKNLWQEQGVQSDHLIAGTRKTNFWDMGLGPCGPCTEIYYDRGSKFDSRGVELIQNDIENDRFIEIWNIVFSEFNNDGENNYTPLINKNIDTGAGFERIVSILQDGPTNFDTDLFLPIIVEVQKLTSYVYKPENYFEKEEKQQKINTYFKVIADHIRSVVHAINDGVEPSNTHRGYIIRRLIRRAYHSGKKLGIQKPFLHTLVNTVKETLIYPIDVEKVAKIIEKEEQIFEKTIENGEILLSKEITKNQGTFDVQVAFKLYETYGFPIELTKEILAEKGIDINFDELEKLKAQHAQVSRGQQFVGMEKAVNSLALVDSKISEFIGYHTLESQANIVFLADSEQEIEESQAGDQSYVIFDQTPFYATGGGQKHDQGFVVQGEQKLEIIKVFKDKFLNNVHIINGKLIKNLPVDLVVNKSNRTNLERNHSATHLLFKSLRDQFGSQIKQLGSDNNENRLTFDFPADVKPTDEEIHQIEARVNEFIAKGVNRQYLETSIKEAEKLNAIMTLEEAEYMDPKNVRLVHFEGLTTDLCGGTHIANTSLIEKFKIVSCQNKGTGIYRIRAITTNEKYLEFMQEVNSEKEQNLARIIAKNKELNPNYTLNILLTSNQDKNSELLDNLIEIAKNDYKNLLKAQKNNVDQLVFDANKIIKINNYKFYLDFTIPNSSLKQAAATWREEHPQVCFVLGSKTKQDNYLLVVASKDLKANEVLQKVLQTFGGKGGGNQIIAQGSFIFKEEIETIDKQICKILAEF